MARKDPVHFEVDGLKELNKAIKDLADKDLAKALRKTNKDAAQLVADAALPNTPEGPTGNLRRSVRALAGAQSAKVAAGSKARVPYARGVHWGVGPRLGLRGPHNIRGTMFLFEAAERMRHRVAALYEEAINDLVRRFR